MICGMQNIPEVPKCSNGMAGDQQQQAAVNSKDRGCSRQQAPSTGSDRCMYAY